MCVWSRTSLVPVCVCMRVRAGGCSRGGFPSRAGGKARPCSPPPRARANRQHQNPADKPEAPRESRPAAPAPPQQPRAKEAGAKPVPGGNARARRDRHGAGGAGGELEKCPAAAVDAAPPLTDVNDRVCNRGSPGSRPADGHHQEQRENFHLPRARWRARAVRGHKSALNPGGLRAAGGQRAAGLERPSPRPKPRVTSGRSLASLLVRPANPSSPVAGLHAISILPGSAQSRRAHSNLQPPGPPPAPAPARLAGEPQSPAPNSPSGKQGGKRRGDPVSSGQIPAGGRKAGVGRKSPAEAKK